MQQVYRSRKVTAPIVVGVDGSPASKAALRWALHQAGRTGTTVEAVAVWAPMPVFYYSYAWAVNVDSERDLAESTHAALLDTLVEVAGEYGCSVPIRPRVLRGRAADELIRAADRAQMLVVGEPSHGTVAGILLGSVAHECVQRAPCPVIVMPATLPTSSKQARLS
ncbi:universal stress protein [Actinoplanes sp. NPDC024001]|uniref:universal stress protein n=1 Tax=Actinoplanes sp. NPDC024001 TaxID=3154598 RepID=UPI0033CAA970